MRCSTDDRNPEIQCATTLEHKKAKFYDIESNQIQATQQFKKPIFPTIFQSLKYMIKDQKSNNLLSKSNQTSKNHVSHQKHGKIRVQNVKGYGRRRSQRSHTDAIQYQQNKQVLLSAQYKKGILQKMLKITQSLGMNEGADYRNYMKTERSQQSKFFSPQKVSNKTKVNQFCQVPEANVKDDIPSKKSSRKKVQKIDPSIMYVLKCNLKQKPAFKETAKVQDIKSYKKRSMRCSDLYVMNKSIRGWTKYGKLQEENQS